MVKTADGSIYMATGPDNGRILRRKGDKVEEVISLTGEQIFKMAIDAKGRIVIVEIKVARGDLLGDAKWPDYLEYCDRFYWGLAPHLDRACLETEAFRPDLCGVIVADGYDAEILRPAPSLPLAAARRKAETERLARAALRRLVVSTDPQCAGWGEEA